MADELTASGLETSSGSEILNTLQDSIQSIYSANGDEIDFGSNTPDGQFTNLLMTIGQTHRELITQVYNATDPDNCVGTQQDTKYKLNYLTRKAGTYTTQNIAITATKTVALQGLDGSYSDNVSTAFTVADDSGNNWYLVDSTTVYAGITSLEFRAANLGAVTPTIGTITKMVTILDGITSVINNVGYTILGTEEESNQAYRLRRARSLYLASGNNEDKIYGAALELDGVNDVQIHVNNTNEADSTGTESHCVWLVVDGGANVDIANILYQNTGGCVTRGDVEIPITNVAGQVLNFKFDRPDIKPYYIKFNIYPVSTIGDINTGAIKEGLVDNLDFLLGQDVDTQTIYSAATIALGEQSGKAYIQDVEVSAGGSATISTTSTALSDLAVDVSIFQSVLFTGLSSDTSGSYVFTYTSDEWQYNGSNVSINDYGITFTGTPAENDTITVEYTAGTWSDLLKVESIQIKYTTDVNRVYFTMLEQ